MMAGTWTEPAFEAVARLLGARTGLAFAPGRCGDAEAGIRRAMARARVADAGRYLALLEAAELTLDDLITELTVGETYFFREPAQFELIRREVIPDVLRRRGQGHALRVWSAGCASGEEAYSLAIVVEEAGLAGRAHILGTDILRGALARAREASYGTWSLRGVDDGVTHRYFRQTHDRRLLDERISKRVAFEFLNLARDAYPSLATGAWGMDLILCRNVLIYFDRETIARVARGLHATLADGGWLLTGPSDPPLADEAPYETVVTPAGVFYRRTGARGRLFMPSRELPPAWSPPAMPVMALEQGAVAVPPREKLVTPEPEAARGVLAQARAALAEGDYDRVLELAQSSEADAAAATLRLQALANQAGSEEAAKAAATEAQRHPLAAELHFLHAILLLDLGHDEAAERAIKRALYLDRSLAVAHFLLGSILRRLGNAEGARRAYENARDLARARPAEEPLALGDGERAGRLVEATTAELALLGARTEAVP